MTGLEISLLIVSVLVVGLLGLTVWQFEKEQAEHEETKRALQRAMDHITQTESGVAQLATAVVPLVERTDWMTGRWGGQFQTLVSMENERNRKAVAARKILMSLPAVTGIGVKAFDPWAPIGDLPLKIEKIDVVERRELRG